MENSIGDTFAYKLINIDDFDYVDTAFPFLLDTGAEFFFGNRRYKVDDWELITEKDREEDEWLEDCHILVNCYQVGDDKELQREIKLIKLLGNKK